MPYAAGTLRTLLIEFAATDRFHRAVPYPYLVGMAREAGAEVRWFRAGVSAAVQFERGELGVGLEGEDLDRLVSEAKSYDPTAVVFDRSPADTVVEALRAALPDARILIYGDGAAGGAKTELEVLPTDPSSWLRLLGVSTPGGPAAAQSGWHNTPDFGYEPVNAAAERMQPLPFVCLGTECTYDRPWRKSPFFKGLDLSGSVREGGCAFCTRPARDRNPLKAGAEEVREQLDALRRTLPAYQGRLAIRMLGEPALRLLEPIVETVKELGFEPADLLLDTRADRLVRRKERIAEAARSLEGTGHRIHVALIGIENFAAAELERLNKGVKPLTNLDAVLALLELEAEHPDTFAFREHGGLSMILFTPWTALEDVAFNLRLVQAGYLERICGKLLTSRLRLHEGLPLVPAARRDGLLIEAYDDSALDTASRNLYEEELPWRFRDERLEPVCRVLIRLSGDTDFGEDDELAALAPEVLDAAAQLGLSPADVALSIVDEALYARGGPELERGGGAAAARALLEGAARVLDERKPGFDGAETEEWVSSGGEGKEEGKGRGKEEGKEEGKGKGTGRGKEEDKGEHAGSGNDPEYLVALSKAGLKPVVKVEPVKPEEVETWRSNPVFPYVQVRRRSGTSEDIREVFFGADPARVEKAVELAQACEAATNAEEEARAIAAIGPELGYPACCAGAFAHEETPFSRSDYCWLTLARRIKDPGPCAPEMNPCCGTLLANYVPCSTSCEATVDLVAREGELFEQLFGKKAAADRAAGMQNPWLIVLRGQMSAIELRPDSEVSERFTFRPGARTASLRELEHAAQADELVHEGERLVLLRAGSMIADLSALAYVWWHGGAFQVPLWERVLAMRRLGQARATTMNVASREEATPGTPAASPEMLRLRALLDEVLARTVQRGALPDGATVLGLEPFGATAFTLRVRAGQEKVDLIISAAKPGERCFFKIGPLAFTHPKDQPIESPVQKRVLRALGHRLRFALREMAEEASGSND